MYLKPTGGAGSFSNFKVTNQKELRNAISTYLEKNWEFEVDEFLSGILYEIDCVIVNNKI